jgi:uncharacterized iron-regulated membrane protein
MRTVHRVLAVFVTLFALWLASTGVFTQVLGLRALLSHAPANDPTMQAIRVGINGPPNFQVIREPDYSADALPSAFDFDAALGTVAKSARAAVGDAPLSFLELRVLNGKPVGQVASKGQLFGFDVSTGASLGEPKKLALPPLATPSLYNDVKDVHRFRIFTPWGLIITVIAAIMMLVMIVTGVIMYYRLLAGRSKMGRRNPFWVAGGWWRTLHRVISIVAVAFLFVQALSGFVLASGSVGVAVNQWLHNGRPGLTKDVSSPLGDAELATMLHTTLTALRADSGDAPIKVLRLRYFAGMPQGVVVAGVGEDTRQVAFNAATGGKAWLSGPGYPDTDMTWGWQASQTAKKIHRGDWMGPIGRWVDLLSGLALLYLAISGMVMYLDLWSRRRKAGRHGFFWSDPQRPAPQPGTASATR